MIEDKDTVERLQATGDDTVGLRLRGYARMLIRDGETGDEVKNDGVIGNKT